MRTILIAATILATSALLTAFPAQAQNLNFLRNSPIAWMDDADEEILRETIAAVLRAPDGTVTDWSNPNTGSRGRVRVLDTHEDLGTTCRNIRMRNETRGRQQDSALRLCLAEDDTWRFAPNASDN